MNTWVQYQTEAQKTAIYPKNYGVLYTALGLVDESVEFLNAIGTKNEAKELGDCFWYFANFIRELGLDITDIDDTAYELEDQAPFNNALQAARQMVETGGKICGIIKKYIRDEKVGQPLSEDKLTQIDFELSWYLNAMYYVMTHLNLDFEEVAEKNLEKLFSRQERGKLNGSGDFR